MIEKPPVDPLTEKYLDQRLFPDYMNHKGSPETFHIIGKSTNKLDAWGKVTGAAQYTADLKLPNLLFGRILRSTQAHALITSINTEKALQLPGVKAIITGADFEGTYGIIPWTEDEQPLNREKVRYIGDEVAAVAATSLEIAAKALELIEVTYQALPSISGIPIKDGKPESVIHDCAPDNISKDVDLTFGDVDRGFQEADLIVEDQFYYEASTHVPIENHAAMAFYSPDQRLTIWSATQTPHYLHRDLAKILKIPENRIRVIKPFLGGGFGGKSEPFSHEFCSALLSIKTGRPVKICLSREETFMAHRGRHAITMNMKLGYKENEGLTLDYQAKLDGGAYSSYGMVTAYYSGTLNAGLYKVNNYRWHSLRFFSNKPAAGPKRGHGTVQPRFAMECLMDQLAEKLQKDPIALRKELFAGEHVKTINELEIGSSGFLECLDRAAEKTQWSQKFRHLPLGKGIGVAGSLYISGTNYPIYPNQMPQSGIQLKADRSGLITIFSGTADIGQGSDTILVQIVSEELGLEHSACTIISGDSDTCPVDLGSYSSRVTLMAGNAAISAARNLKSMIAGVLAREWQVEPERLVFENGTVFVAEDETRRMSFTKAIRKAEAQLGSLCATGSYTTPNRGGRYRGALVGPSPAYSFSVHIAEVTVDLNSGMVTVDRIVAAHDCGRALNPKSVEGQIEGSVYMGTGEAIMEAYRLEKGLLTTPNLLEYKIPTILDTPTIESIIVEAPDPEGPYGAKEAGEGPLLPAAPAISNAIYDAVGIRMNTLPFTPDKILKALKRKKP